MLLISMLSVVYSKFQWNESVQFATLPFRNAGFKVQVCMARGEKGEEVEPCLTCCMCCSCVRCQSLSFRFVLKLSSLSLSSLSSSSRGLVVVSCLVG